MAELIGAILFAAMATVAFMAFIELVDILRARETAKRRNIAAAPMPVNWTISASVWLMNEVSNALNSSATRDGCVEMPREPSMAIVSAMKAQVQMKTTEAYKVYFAAIATAEKEKL